MIGIILEKLILSVVIIPLAAMIRFAGGRNFGAVWRKLLWIFMAVWMLVPFSFSFGSSVGFRKEFTQFNRSQAIEAGYEFMEYIPEIIIEDSGRYLSVPLIYYGIIFLLLVAFVKILYHIRQYYSSVNYLLDTMSEETDRMIVELWRKTLREFHIRKTIPVYRSSLNRSPMMMGGLSPVLILPDKLHECRHQLIYNIMCHEAMHYKSGDLWYKRLILFVSDLYWYNPFVYWMKKLAFGDVEFACDERVTEKLSDENRILYCHAILSMTQINDRDNDYNVQFSVNAKQLKRRMENIFEKKDTVKGVILTVVFCIIFFLAAGLTDVRADESGYLNFQTEDDIARIFSDINWFYFSDNSKLGRVELSYTYHADKQPETITDAGENLSIVVACEKYDELSDIALEGIRTVFRMRFHCESIDVEIKRLELR